MLIFYHICFQTARFHPKIVEIYGCFVIELSAESNERIMNMFYKIENEFFTCEIDDMGAQLHSLKSKENGKEYIWYGKTEIWYGQAPVLFPVIGQLIDDK